MFSAGIVSTTLLAIFAIPEATVAAAGLTLLTGLLLYRSFRTKRGIRAQPKFTRHRMRERERDQEEADAALGFGDVEAMGAGLAGVGEEAGGAEDGSDGDGGPSTDGGVSETDASTTTPTEIEVQGEDDRQDDGRDGSGTDGHEDRDGDR